MNKIAEHKKIAEMKEKAGLNSRAKSILKPRSTKNSKKNNREASVSSSKKVRFEQKKSVVLFKTTGSVLRFKNNLMKSYFNRKPSQKDTK